MAPIQSRPSTEHERQAPIRITRNAGWPAGLLLASSVTVALFLVNTRYGIGVLPDSTRYMGMNDIPYDAPLYAWLLTSLTLLPISMAAAAKLAGLTLAGANAALTWHLLERTTGRLAHTAIGTALIILSPQFVTLHASALSEPLFLFFFLVTYLAFLRYLAADRMAWLAVCAVLIGLCALVRFTAPPIGVALALVLLVRRRHPLPFRLTEVTLLTLVAGGLFAGWGIASEMIAGHSLGREMRLHGNMGATEWMKSLEAMAAWLLPDAVPLALRAGLLAVVGAAAVYLVTRQTGLAIARTRQAPVAAPLMPMALGLFIIAYMIFMVAAVSVEANLSLTSRYAFPPYVAAVLMITIVLAQPTGLGDRLKPVTLGLACLAAIVLLGHVVRTATRTRQTYQEGIGFAAPVWTSSPTLRHIMAVPPGATIWSNAPDAIAFVTGHRAHWLPARVLLRTGLPDPAHPYAAQAEEVRQSLTRHEGYLVFLRGVEWRFYLADEKRLVQDLGLHLVASERDGRIYAGPGVPGASFPARERSR